MNIEKDFTYDDLEQLSQMDMNELKKVRDQILMQISNIDNKHDYIDDVYSVETCVEQMIDMDVDLKFAKDMNCCVAGNGAMFDKNIQGVIPEAMTMLFNYRKELKDNMKSKKKIIEKIK